MYVRINVHKLHFPIIPFHALQIKPSDLLTYIYAHVIIIIPPLLAFSRFLVKKFLSI